ncbi:nucleotide-binding domain-containing protein [Lentinus tigrinus ALCF2SS1-7]|uniref:Nucleotide-binding domain-containing protein n=1 Tax=Lentinus tigrinus ALCF2SS1-6 TaxID=1328759 RepID=A0A5C2SU59_9APHY|nr:nucleotide-binding domain-containing protein [Lentinus tigrinus ALCF2SS1-6]RPD80884.1 nucleotide-binding domain-containing protein [Lentinus tigrinus ALCF2SS1-7]
MPTTVVLGAGIIGLSTAHSLAALAPPDHRIHIVEPAPKLFSSASGKAAGFIAKDWFAPAIASLGRLSFDLHRDFAQSHNGRARWGFSESISYSLDHTYQPADSSSDTDARAEGVQGAPISQEPPSDDRSSDAQQSARIDDRQTDVSGRSGSQGDSGLDWLLTNQTRATAASSETGSNDTAPSASSEGATVKRDDVPRWLRAKPEALEAISDKTSTAQVHPRRLCEFLLEQCLATGVILHHPARATKLLREEHDPNGRTRIRVEYLGESSDSPEARTRVVDILCESSDSPEARTRVVDILCENIVIAAGCWTPQVYATLFPNASRMPRITHLAGYSVTLKSKHWPPATGLSDQDDTQVPRGTSVEESSSSAPALLLPSPCHAIFTDAAGFAPEIFSRATGDVWVGGLNPSNETLPTLPTDAQIDATQVERLLAVVHALCGDDVEVRKQSLCFRPVSATGRPIIARVHEADLGDGLKPAGLDGQGGVFVATGHGPWGISLSLGTGRVVAEMVLGRETSADVSALSRW